MRKTLIELTCVLLLSAVTVLWGQAAGGTLSGRITSADGTPVPNAAVTVTNINTDAAQKVLTGPDGTFSIAGLPPGTYRVDVETAGFKHTTRQDVELSAAGPGAVNITLEPGNVNETVEVRASSPAVESFGGQVAMGLNTRPARELPVEDRNFQQLIGLQPGVTPPEPALDLSRDPERNRFYSTTGQAPFENLYSMDGVLNWEPFRSTAIRAQPLESIQQLNSTTANYTENKGFASGALVNNVTPGGTNSWHGSLFEFWSGDVVRARNFFDAGANPNPRFVYNQLGGTVGGAIVPDKTFVFGSYEGTFENGGLTQLTSVPASVATAGNFSGIPGLTLYNPNTGLNGTGRTPLTGNTIPAGLINPASAAIASNIPAPNLPGLYNNYVSNTPFRNDDSKVDARIDQRFADRTSAFVRYGYSNDFAYQESPLGNIIGAGTRGRLVAQNAAIDLTHSFSPSLISDLRMGYNRYDQKVGSWGSQAALGNALGVNLTGNNLLGVSIPGMLPIGQAPYIPEHPVDNNFNWVWTWGWNTSHHDIKWGFEARRFRVDNFLEPTFPGFGFGPNGAAAFGPGATLANNGTPLSQYGSFYNSYAAFLMGAPSQVGQASFLAPPSIRQSEYAVWVGDTFHILPHFTADLGVRYELYSPLEPRMRGGAAFFDANTNTFNYAGIGGTPMHWQHYDTDNVAPRIGLAYRPTSRTVIRGGYAIEYFQTPYQYTGFMAPMIGSAAGVQGTYAVAPIQGQFGPTVSSTVPTPASLQNGAPAGNLPAAIVPRNVETPYVQTFSAQVQQDFYWSTVLSVGYVGALDRHLTGIEELNAAAPGTGIAGLPFGSLGRTASTLLYNDGLTSNYNALQASLSKRFSHGVSFLASYTWSKALGYTTANQLLLNPTNLGANYGPLDYDRQQVLSISHLFELPWGKKSGSLLADIIGGWQLNGIFSWSTGTPLTVTADPLACACPGNTVLANLNSATPYANGGTAYLNPAAFSVLPDATGGNLGRGALRAPGYRNYDLSLFKTFHVHDRYVAEFRGEAYNLTNSPRFMNPVTNVNSPAFGQQVGTINGAFGRQVNLALRILF
jgi:hypothetical protein